MAQTIEKNNSRRLISVMGLFLFSILGGLIVGLTTGVIGSFLYLVFLFPVFMGLAGGYMVNENLKYTKVRNQTFVLLSSILTVIVLYGSFHYMRYVGLQARTTFQLFGDFSDKNLEAGKLIVVLRSKKKRVGLDSSDICFSKPRRAFP